MRICSTFLRVFHQIRLAVISNGLFFVLLLLVLIVRCAELRGRVSLCALITRRPFDVFFFVFFFRICKELTNSKVRVGMRIDQVNVSGLCRRSSRFTFSSIIHIFTIRILFTAKKISSQTNVKSPISHSRFARAFADVRLFFFAAAIDYSRKTTLLSIRSATVKSKEPKRSKRN